MAASNYDKVVLLVPEPFDGPWKHLIGICERVRNSVVDMNDERWPIHALGIKTANTTLSIATLAAMRQWSEALILGRSLFESEIIVKFLLEADTRDRVREYLSEIADEEERVIRKMNQGVSVSAQVMRNLFSDAKFRTQTRQPASKKGAKTSVRERAKRVALERSYDLVYWMGSIVAHSHALCLSDWNKELIDAKSPFVDFFSNKHRGLPGWLVLEAHPMNALDTLQLVDFHFQLGEAVAIEDAREAFRDVVCKVSKGAVVFTSDIERGAIKLVGEDGTEHTYTPTESGRDPLDELP